MRKYMVVVPVISPDIHLARASAKAPKMYLNRSVLTHFKNRLGVSMKRQLKWCTFHY